MSAADRMVVRTRGGSYRSVPRRQGLAMIAVGRATADDGAQAAVQDVEAPGVPPEPQDAPTGQQDPQTGVIDLSDPVHDTASLEYVGLFEEELPDGVPTVEAVELPPLPRGNAGRADWAEYAQTHLGLVVTSDQTRNDIRDAAQDAHAAALARLPQPAVTGGRLDTPEDEPVTDGSVTDDEDSRTE